MGATAIRALADGAAPSLLGDSRRCPLRSLLSPPGIARCEAAANTSRVCTIPGFGNRGSPAICRLAQRQPPLTPRFGLGQEANCQDRRAGVTRTSENINSPPRVSSRGRRPQHVRTGSNLLVEEFREGAKTAGHSAHLALRAGRARGVMCDLQLLAGQRAGGVAGAWTMWSEHGGSESSVRSAWLIRSRSRMSRLFPPRSSRKSISLSAPVSAFSTRTTRESECRRAPPPPCRTRRYPGALAHGVPWRGRRQRESQGPAHFVLLDPATTFGGAL